MGKDADTVRTPEKRTRKGKRDEEIIIPRMGKDKTIKEDLE